MLDSWKKKKSIKITAAEPEISQRLYLEPSTTSYWRTQYAVCTT